MGHTLQNESVVPSAAAHLCGETKMLLHKDSGGGVEGTSWQQMEADSQLFAFALFEKEMRD